MINLRFYHFSTSVITIILFMMLFSVLLGCSSGANEPTSPSSEQAPEDIIRTSNESSRSLWGYYQGYANTETGEFEMTPMRSAEAHYNLVNVLNSTFGLGYKILWGQSDPEAGIIRVRVTLYHPFPFTPLYSGFDVRGILITGGFQPIGMNLWTAGEEHPQLTNADGWTRWWNPVEFTNPGYYGYTDGNLGANDFGQYNAQINGFKIFADALTETQKPDFLASIDLDSPGGRAVFSSSEKSRQYIIKFPPGTSYFNYALDASWAPPSANPPEVPDDFPAAANAHEAWLIEIDTLENTLKYIEETGDHEGTLRLNITVYDWQGKMNGTVASQVTSVNVISQEVLGFNIGQGTLTYDDGTRAMYMVDLTDVLAPSQSGESLLTIEVVSKFGKYKQSWQAAPSAPLAAYQLYKVNVAGGDPPTELQKVFGVHAYVLRTSSGNNPVITDAEIEEDIAWANEFFNQYGFGLELATKSYINSNNYYNFYSNDIANMWNSYHDTTGLINLYYVNTIVDGSGAFAIIPCEFEQSYGINTLICFGANDNHGIEEVLAHELGHVIGMLTDAYLLDFFSCYQIGMGYCGYYPTDQYCNNNTRAYGNLMYYVGLWPNADPDDYYLTSTDIGMSTSPIDSQGENLAYFHSHYNSHFKDMQ